MKLWRYLIVIILAGLNLISCGPENTSQLPRIQDRALDTLLISGIYTKRIDLETTFIADVLLSNQLNQETRLSELVSKGPKLVFFFSEVSCFECVSQQIGFISKVISDSADLPIVIVNTSQNLRSAYAVLIEKGLDLPYYSTNFQNLGFDRHKHPGPLFFIVDTDFRCKFSYEPIIHLQNITYQYLSRVKKIFFSPQ